MHTLPCCLFSVFVCQLHRLFVLRMRALNVQLTSSNVASRIVPLTQFMPEKTVRAQVDKAIAMLKVDDRGADESLNGDDRSTPKMQVLTRSCQGFPRVVRSSPRA